MYLSLPLPSTTMRTMTITTFSSDNTGGLSTYTVSVPKSGDCITLINALSNACSLRDDERLLVAEVFLLPIVSLSSQKLLTTTFAFPYCLISMAMYRFTMAPLSGTWMKLLKLSL
jgi:hypothetical protein